jgi:mRNA interferase MazF
MKRGELWWADLGLPRGSAPALRRPVLIISADQYNRSKLQTVTVAVLTTNVALAALPGNVAVAAEVTGLDVDSVVNVTQIATLDRRALEEHAGSLPDWLMAQVNAGLARALGLAHL